MSKQPKAQRPNEATFEVTLTIQGRYDVPSLIEDWTPDHAYGPVEKVMIEREMHSARRGYDVLNVDVSQVKAETDE